MFSMCHVRVRKTGVPIVYQCDVRVGDMTKMIKRAATHFGLDPDDFSAYSIRHGSISDMANQGASDRDSEVLRAQEACLSTSSGLVDSPFVQESTAVLTVRLPMKSAKVAPTSSGVVPVGSPKEVSGFSHARLLSSPKKSMRKRKVPDKLDC